MSFTNFRTKKHSWLEPLFLRAKQFWSHRYHVYVNCLAVTQGLHVDDFFLSSILSVVHEPSHAILQLASHFTSWNCNFYRLRHLWKLL